VSFVHVARMVDLRRVYTILATNQQITYTVLKAKAHMRG